MPFTFAHPAIVLPLKYLLNSLQGEIAHMNTLSNDFYRGFKVDTVPVGMHHYPFYTEFTEAEQSRIWCT
jgi:hypothetical protein